MLGRQSRQVDEYREALGRYKFAIKQLEKFGPTRWNLEGNSYIIYSSHIAYISYLKEFLHQLSQELKVHAC